MQQIKSGIKKRWTPQQDQALREIKQNLKYKSWNMIAKKMATDFGFNGRSQKQCRDRYQNYLKGREQSFLWSQEEQKKMFKLFRKQGSRWQLISTYFTNIKGIHIKNKFYTRVRKAVRQVNSVIEFYFAKKYTPFEFTIISKLVSLISRHVEQTKYEKRQVMIQSQNNNDNLDKQHQHTKILYQLIQLTNHQGCQLFPQLGLRACPHGQKKKLFKRLIKRLKSLEIQYQKSNQNHYFPINSPSPNPQNDNQIDNLQNNFQQRRQIKYQNIEKHTICHYKIITNDRQRQKSHFKIISRIKKLKLSSQRQYLRLQKDQFPHVEQFQEIEEKHENQLKNNVDYQIEHQQPLTYPQFYLLNTQPPIYLPNNIDFNNIQLFYNME